MRYSIPGIYFEKPTPQNNDISMQKSSVAGFIGLAQKGPLHSGVRIHSYNQFASIFGGFTDYSYLAFSVYGFFLSGGKECVVVRTAHIGKEEDKGSVNKAELVIRDVDQNPAAVITADTEGSWGNNIDVKIQHISGDSLYISNTGYEGSRWVEVECDLETISFKKGDFITLRGERTLKYSKIKDVAGKKLFLENNINDDFFSENSKIVCEKILLNISLIYLDDIEEYLHLSPNAGDEKYFTNVINDRSKLVQINVESEGFRNIIENVNYSNLQNGTDGLVSLTPGDFIGYYKGLGDNKGIGIFEAYDDIDIIAAPDINIFEDIVFNNYRDARDSIFSVQKAIIDQCERLGNRFAVLDPPTVSDIHDLRKWRNKFDSAYAAVYYPKIEILNPDDMSGLTSLYVPPSGHIAGIYSLCDLQEGVHRAPANKFINGAVGLSTQLKIGEYEILNPDNINCLRYIPGRGIKVWGARTLSSDPSWRYISVRRTFSQIKEAIRNGTRWAVFEPNTIKLRKKVIRHITAFLIEMWRKGYLMGTRTDDAFFVICDDTNNYKQTIDAGILNVDIGIAVSKPAEFLVIKLAASSDNNSILLDE